MCAIYKPSDTLFKANVREKTVHVSTCKWRAVSADCEIPRVTPSEPRPIKVPIATPGGAAQPAATGAPARALRDSQRATLHLPLPRSATPDRMAARRSYSGCSSGGGGTVPDRMSAAPASLPYVSAFLAASALRLPPACGGGSRGNSPRCYVASQGLIMLRTTSTSNGNGKTVVAQAVATAAAVAASKPHQRG